MTGMAAVIVANVILAALKLTVVAIVAVVAAGAAGAMGAAVRLGSSQSTASWARLREYSHWRKKAKTSGSVSGKDIVFVTDSHQPVLDRAAVKKGEVAIRSSVCAWKVVGAAGGPT